MLEIEIDDNLARFAAAQGQLDPETLSCDGELNRHEINVRYVSALTDRGKIAAKLSRLFAVLAANDLNTLARTPGEPMLTLTAVCPTHGQVALVASEPVVTVTCMTPAPSGPCNSTCTVQRAEESTRGR